MSEVEEIDRGPARTGGARRGGGGPRAVIASSLCGAPRAQRREVDRLARRADVVDAHDARAACARRTAPRRARRRRARPAAASRSTERRGTTCGSRRRAPGRRRAPARARACARGARRSGARSSRSRGPGSMTSASRVDAARHRPARPPRSIRASDVVHTSRVARRRGTSPNPRISLLGPRACISTSAASWRRGTSRERAGRAGTTRR